MADQSKVISDNIINITLRNKTKETIVEVNHYKA